MGWRVGWMRFSADGIGRRGVGESGAARQPVLWVQAQDLGPQQESDFENAATVNPVSHSARKRTIKTFTGAFLTVRGVFIY